MEVGVLPLCYEQNFTVEYTECDPFSRMSPGAILRRIQDIGTAQCDELGMDEEMYRRTETVFLLSRLSLQIYNAPLVRQAIRMQTRAYGRHRALYQRVTSLFDEQNNKLCEADSRWVLVSTNTRRILRTPPEGMIMPFNETPGAEEHDLDIPPHDMPAELETLHASYSLCDNNGHINNTRYADLICDRLPIEALRETPVKRMLLIYRNEIPLGHTFSLGKSWVGSNGIYFTAEENEHKSFEGYVEL